VRSAARIDLDALEHNVGVVRAHAPGVQVMAVVKADGYGHGAVPCARAAVAAGATWLGVAFPEEALELRAAGLGVPVLAWLFGPAEDLGHLVAADVDLGIYSEAELGRAVHAARSTGAVARVHLKADTGLSRGGAPAAEWADLCTAAAKAEADGTVAVVGVWSHLASSEQGPDHTTNGLQREAFETALTVAHEHGLRPQLRHLANSGATLSDPRTHYDLVRVGAALYGLDAVPGVDLGLRPVMSLRSTVVLTKRVPAGSGVSYGHRYVTERETTLALVPLGYGDGVPRHGTNAGPVLVRGARHRVCGTVAMDQFVVDVGDAPAQVGDEVVLFGAGGLLARDWAEPIGTLDYEVVTRVGARVPRHYVGGPA
jgi:alanine racemase